MENITLIHGDCLEEMKKVPECSVDMILCDLPYGTTSIFLVMLTMGGKFQNGKNENDAKANGDTA